MTHVTPRVLCVGVAGAGREPERQALWQALVEPRARRRSRGPLRLHRSRSTTRSATGPACCSSAARARSRSAAARRARSARCGGWGPVCGDEGSGAWIGRRALSVVTAAADGREPETALMGAVLTAAQVNEPQELIAWAAQATPAQLATLAPVVIERGRGGRPARERARSASPWRSSCCTCARWRASCSATSAPRCRWRSRAACSRRGSTLRKRLEHRLKSAVPGAQIRAGEVNPARGAVRGALALCRGDDRPSRCLAALNPEAQPPGEPDEARIGAKWTPARIAVQPDQPVRSLIDRAIQPGERAVRLVERDVDERDRIRAHVGCSPHGIETCEHGARFSVPRERRQQIRLAGHRGTHVRSGPVASYCAIALSG